jgi:Flp pilus assembly protein TadD
VERGIEIAEENYRVRPTAEALTLLAQAYASAGRLNEATSAMKQALATPIATPQMHATAAYLFRASGDRESAERYTSMAIAEDRSAYEELAWLARPRGSFATAASP